MAKEKKTIFNDLETLKAELDKHEKDDLYTAAYLAINELEDEIMMRELEIFELQNKLAAALSKKNADPKTKDDNSRNRGADKKDKGNNSPNEGAPRKAS